MYVKQTRSDYVNISGICKEKTLLSYEINGIFTLKGKEVIIQRESV
jgi:hypothetical protein